MSRWTAPLAALAGFSRGAIRDIENRSPVPLAPRQRSMFDRTGYVTATDMFAFMATYGTDSTVYSIASRLAESTAEAEWRLTTNDEDPENRKRVASHAVLDFLDHPNDFQTFAEIVESGQQHFDLVGETDIVLGTMPGVKLPMDMWVLRPDRIAPVPDPYEFLAGWIYTAPGDGEKIPLDTAELLRMRHPAPLDPYRGQGAIQALLRDLDAQRFTKEWQAAFFQNSARPGGIIQVDRRLDDDEFTELRDRWNEQHRGVSKAHRVAILEQGTWVETAFSLKDLQMAELENVGRDKALIAFGMPKSMLGIVEDVNRANAEAGEYVFARWMIRPRLARWRSMLNRQLLPLFVPAARAGRPGLMLDFQDPVPENSEAAIAELNVKADVVVALVEAGFDAAQVLDMVGWPDLSFEKPEPPAPPQIPGQGGTPPTSGGMGDALAGALDNAMRWKVVGHPDDNCCQPCRDNLGKLYRNRSSAYADYPGGAGYIKCVGAQYGNDCRCKVIKRRADG